MKYTFTERKSEFQKLMVQRKDNQKSKLKKENFSRIFPQVEIFPEILETLRLSKNPSISHCLCLESRRIIKTGKRSLLKAFKRFLSI